VERRSDLLIGTLRKIIEAVGGELEIRAILPAGVVFIKHFQDFRKPANHKNGGRRYSPAPGTPASGDQSLSKIGDSTPTMIFTAAQAAEIYKNGNHQYQEIDALQSLVRVNHPGVSERCEGQENEAEQRQNQSAVGALQII
jgi:hypothetical protein